MKCFVIMPFDQTFADVYVAIKSALENAIPGEQVRCYRLDEEAPAGRITDRLLKELQESSVCVADVTGNNPNVMWEVGYAMALGKPLLILTQEIPELPFDLKDMLAIRYSRDALSSSLTPSIKKSFIDTLGAYELPREQTQLPQSEPETMSIAVTGSSSGNQGRCERRVESLLSPYLGRGIYWYCGSNGIADECALRFLSKSKESVRVVGYHGFDISPGVQEVVQANGIPFVDARKEQVPRGVNAPTQRDLLFLMKADLVFLLWNGSSSGTKGMIKFYEDQGRDHAVGYF